MTALLHTKDLAVGHRGRVLLRELGLVLNAGELVALLGVNGIGKSTLLHTLTGALPALQGEVLLKGETLSRLHPRERAKRVSIVLTERAIPALLDVRTVVALGRQPWTDARGRLTSEDERVVDQAMAQAGVSELAGRDLAHLSDGERQLVMVARALAQDTPLLLLDEPTAFLDVVNRARVFQLLRQLADGGRGVLFSTHDVAQALRLADRLLIAHTDGTVWQGTVAEAREQGALESAFGTAMQ